MKRILSAYGLLLTTLLVAFLAMPVALATGARAEPGQIALVIAPPWAIEGGAAAVAAAAGGREVGPMRAPFAVLAVLEAPDMALRYGAWLVLDGRFVAQVCGVDFNEREGDLERV